jgi:hypothetical protein
LDSVILPVEKFKAHVPSLRKHHTENTTRKQQKSSKLTSKTTKCFGAPWRIERGNKLQRYGAICKLLLTDLFF